MQIRRATASDLDLLAPLYDAYRQFYEQPPDPALARRYLADRMANNESVVFLATDEVGGRQRGLGFTQLYQSFCSVMAAPVYILYDLFVAPDARQGGVGRALMERAREHAQATGARRIELSTAHSNTRAQALYESLGYQRDSVFRVYALRW